MENSCYDCIHFDCGDESVGLLAGCTHDSLYDENGNLIDEANDLIFSYMIHGCPLKEQSN